uniref:LIM/homeobox protein Lhx9 n=1 Tax=Cynoglossus semilaevis TaxID=244447 RepID=A0A3P8WTC5_CYNSE
QPRSHLQLSLLMLVRHSGRKTTLRLLLFLFEDRSFVCCGCRGQVYDRFFLLAAGGAWHSSCLRCSQCQCELQTHGSLYCRHGNIYCQQDYNRMFGGGRCSRCSQPIPASALVMRSGHMTFHPQCFCCQECDVTLLPGSLYSVHGHRLLCQSHCRGRGNFPPSLDRQVRTQQRGGGGGGGVVFDGPEQNQVVAEGEESVSSPEPRQAGGRSHRSTKRIRTCFRSEQLRALESYFAQKHNPDGKDWTYLVHRTGLPKRVLQVRPMTSLREHSSDWSWQIFKVLFSV